MRDIRQGMLDGFFGRKTPHAWRLNPSVPIPKDTMTPGLEGTGPAIDLGMAMGALNTGAASWMWDWEDAGGDYKDQLYQAWENLRGLARAQVGREALRPPDEEEGGKPQYTIDLPPEKWPTIFHRVPGLHLQNRQISLDGEQVPAMIPALVIHAVNNYDTQKKNGSGVYYYVPKIETWQEARLVVEAAEAARRGARAAARHAEDQDAERARRVRAAAGSDHVGAAREPHRPERRALGLLNSREEMFRHDPAMVIPDPNTVTMTEPSLTYYTMRNALLALLAGGMPIGGMAAQMQNPRAPENDAKALRDIWFDKLRERLTGLFKIDGKLHDTYRQSWVATIDAVVRRSRPRTARHRRRRSAARRRQADAGREEAARRSRPRSKDGKITPLELTEADLTPEKLFSEEARKKLLSRPQGPTTEDGLRYAMYMATEFMYQQLLGNNAAAIYDPRTGLRFMNDLATYEIFWHFLYLTVFHGVELTADGKYSKEGRSRHARAVHEAARRAARDGEGAVQEARDRVREDERGARAQILKRQVVDEKPDGRLVPQPRWIKYGSRVLLSIIEESRRRSRRRFSTASSRQSRGARREGEAGRRRRQPGSRQKVLRAHDFVYASRTRQDGR